MLKEYVRVFIMHGATNKNVYLFGGVISFYSPFLCFFPLLPAALTFSITPKISEMCVLTIGYCSSKTKR